MKTDDLTTSKVTPIRQDALPELSTIRSALTDAEINTEYERIGWEIMSDTARVWGHPRKAVNDIKPLQSDDNDAQTALEIANRAAREWNHSRQGEVRAAKSLQSDDVQSQMAAEVFAAFMTYLKTIPSGVQHKVIAKFHAINLPNGHRGVITL
jgi:hypothetical protein